MNISEAIKAVEMVRAMSHQFGTCDGCKHLGSKCSVSDFGVKKMDKTIGNGRVQTNGLQKTI